MLYGTGNLAHAHYAALALGIIPGSLCRVVCYVRVLEETYHAWGFMGASGGWRRAREGAVLLHLTTDRGS